MDDRDDEWGGVLSEILIEVRPSRPESGDLQSRLPSVREAFTRRASELSESIVEVAQTFRQRVDQALTDGAEDETAEARWGVEEIRLDFGISLKAENGVIIAKTSGEANFSVSLTWRRTTTGSRA